MKRSLKFLSLTMAMLIAGGTLAACGGGDNSADNGGNYVATLKIGYGTCGYGDEYVEKWTEAYNAAHPDEQIRFEIDNNAGDINSRLQTNSELSDIYISLATFWQNWARSGYLEPLDDIFTMTNSDGKVYADCLENGYENTGIINGTHYVVPHSGGGGASMAYSQKLFTDNGWEVPETIDDLFALVDKINALPCNNDSSSSNDIAPFAWGGQVITYWDPFIYSIWASVDGRESIETFFKAESAEIYANRAGLQRALEVFRDLVCTGEGEPKNSLPGAMGKNHILSQNDFVQGRAAILINASGVYNETARIRPEDFDLRAFSYPTVSEGEKDENGDPIHYSIITNDMYDFMCIPKNIPEENKVYAKKFLAWLSSTEACEIFAQYAKAFSPFKCDYASIQGDAWFESKNNVRKNTQLIIGMTDSPLVETGKLKVFPSGNPYSEMILKNAKPSTIINNNYNYAKGQWATWLDEVGVNK